MQLLLWQNLIFLLPIALGALYILMMAVGVSFGDHDVGADAGHGDVSLDHDADVGGGDLAHDVGGDMAHGDVGGDAAHADVGHADAGHATSEGGANHGAQVGAFGSFIGFLGVGKAPFMILLMSYCFVWGTVGLGAVTLWGTPAVWKAIILALAAAVLVTRFLASLIAKLVPSVESYHTPLRELVGLLGEVLYEVTDSSGVVRLRDVSGDLRDVSSRVPAGAPHIPAGKRVMLLRLDATARTFLVTPSQGEPK